MSEQRPSPATALQAPQRDDRGRFLKGQSGNTQPGNAFRPGHSGNPGGVPAYVKELRDRAATHGAAAIDFLASVVGSDTESTSDRITAATALLDRAGVRPVALEGDKLNVPPLVDVESLRVQIAARVVGLLAPGGAGEPRVLTAAAVDVVAKVSP